MTRESTKGPLPGDTVLLRWKSLTAGYVMWYVGLYLEREVQDRDVVLTIWILAKSDTLTWDSSTRVPGQSSRFIEEFWDLRVLVPRAGEEDRRSG